MAQAERAAAWWASKLEIEDKREQFKENFLKLFSQAMHIIEESTPWRIHANWFTIDVDYDPDNFLISVLHMTGIECRGTFFSAVGIFPNKMQMNVYNDGTIKVSERYGGQFEEL